MTTWPVIRIRKMSGAGNDFVALRSEDAAILGERLVPWVRAVCRRGLSVGADGALIVGRRDDGRVAVKFLNPDGSEAFCGNGTRCAARFAVLEGLAGRSMVLATCRGGVPAEVLDGDRVRLVIPEPRVLGDLEIRVEDQRVRGGHIDAGAPHFVVEVENAGAAPLGSWGPALRRASEFGPHGVNVDLMSWGADGVLDLRTWERGVEGETLSCGSGAIAAALAARRRDPARSAFEIRPLSRMPLTVRFLATAEVEFEGDAREVLSGTVSAGALAGAGASQPGSSVSSPPAST